LLHGAVRAVVVVLQNAKEAYHAMSSTLEPIRVAPDTTSVSGAVPNELDQLLLSAGFRDRQLTALSARLGLTGFGSRTLAEAGATVGLTRERVRQLECRLRDHSAGSSHPLAAVRGALRRTERIVPAPSSSVSAVLARVGLVPQGFQVSGLLRIADVLGLEHDLCELDTNVVCKRDLVPAQEMLKLARHVVRRDGVGNVARVAEELSPTVDAAPARRLLSVHAEVNWLDRSHSWFLVTGTRSRAGGLLGKMLSASCPLTLADVHDGLRRAPNPVLVPRHLVASLCDAFPWPVVDRARKIVTLKVALDVRSTHSSLELAILRIFAEHGSSLTAREMVARGERLGLNSSSVRVYLTRMPAIERLERGLYSLRGNATAVAA
jgi:hypothetical protein